MKKKFIGEIFKNQRIECLVRNRLRKVIAEREFNPRAESRIMRVT